MQGYIAIVERKTRPRGGNPAQTVLDVVDLNTTDAALAQNKLSGLGLIKEGQTAYLAQIVAKAVVRPSEVVLEKIGA